MTSFPFVPTRVSLPAVPTMVAVLPKHVGVAAPADPTAELIEDVRATARMSAATVR
jgi:hypothetical protein